MERIGVFSFLKGTSYEIGINQGEELKQIPRIESVLFNQKGLENKETEKSIELLEMYYPDLLEELKGVADSFNRDLKEHKFLDMAYLRQGGCSLAVVSSQQTVNQKPYVLRIYDLGKEIADFRMCSTDITNNFAHSGFSVMFFGRSEGMNKHGLCVTFASCGLPVGYEKGMIHPQVEGLNFMVIVRMILETCQTTEEAITLLRDIPIASNMNLLITDRAETTVIVETLNGEKFFKESNESYTIATNHALFKEAQSKQKHYLNQSKKRFDLMEDTFNVEEKLTKKDLQRLMATEYPKGLAMQNYTEYFGTVYSALFDTTDRTIDFTFGSPAHNLVYTLKVGEDFSQRFFELNLPNKSYGSSFWESHSFE